MLKKFYNFAARSIFLHFCGCSKAVISTVPEGFVVLCPGAPEGLTSSGSVKTSSETGPLFKASFDRLVKLSTLGYKASDPGQIRIEQ